MESRGITEHVLHIKDIVGLPAADIAIKSTGTLEHVGHVSDSMDVPVPNGLIKGYCSVEPVTSMTRRKYNVRKEFIAGTECTLLHTPINLHGLHGSTATCVPSTDINVKGIGALQQDPIFIGIVGRFPEQ